MGLFSAPPPDDDVTAVDLIKAFCVIHWKGIVCFVTPIIMVAALAPFPPEPSSWVLYTTLVMTVYWLTECIPLEITSFLPVFTFPIGSVMSTTQTCHCYINEFNILLLGVLFLAFALKQCGILQRIGYILISSNCTSHILMLLMTIVWTAAISSLIPNTVATAVMIPIVLDILRIFETKGKLKMYEMSPKKEEVATNLTTGYCCAVAYSATIGGFLTLTGTSTTLMFKGLYMDRYPTGPDRLTYLNVIILNIAPVIACVGFLFIYIALLFFGLFRDSDKLKLNPVQMEAVQKAIKSEQEKLGPITMTEVLTPVLIFITLTILWLRYPLFFDGWGAMLAEEIPMSHNNYVEDASTVIYMCLVMFLVPGSLLFFKNFTAKGAHDIVRCLKDSDVDLDLSDFLLVFKVKIFHEDMPNKPVKSVMHWPDINATVPFCFIFLMGSGIALQQGMIITGLDDQMLEMLDDLKDVKAEVLIFLIMFLVTIVTCFASNVVVAILSCPFAMVMAEGVPDASPLWFCMAAGYASSLAFILPIGAPGNLLVYRTAKIPLKKMMIAGAGPTVFTLIIYYVIITFLSPILYNLNGMDSMPFLPEYDRRGPPEE